MGNLGVRIILVYSLSIQRRLEEVFLELKGESEYILEPEVRMSLNPVNWTLHKFLHLVITLSFFRGSSTFGEDLLKVFGILWNS